MAVLAILPKFAVDLQQALDMGHHGSQLSKHQKAVSAVLATFMCGGTHIYFRPTCHCCQPIWLPAWWLRRQ